MCVFRRGREHVEERAQFAGCEPEREPFVPAVQGCPGRGLRHRLRAHRQPPGAASGALGGRGRRGLESRVISI